MDGSGLLANKIFIYTIVVAWSSYEIEQLGRLSGFCVAAPIRPTIKQSPSPAIHQLWTIQSSFDDPIRLFTYKKAVLPQGNRAMPQVFFSVEVRQQHCLQV